MSKDRRKHNIFFYSDPHFGHKNVITYCKRPYTKFIDDEHFGSIQPDTGDMKEDFIRRYNKVVRNEDIVVWVGDCFFVSNNAAAEIMSRLNGKKVLVRGNHDRKPNQMLNMGFDWVCEEMKMRIAGHQVTVKHYPFRISRWRLAFYGGPDDDLLNVGGWKKLIRRLILPHNHIRYWFRRPRDHGGFHIHGHTHSSQKFDGRQIHVGVDAWDYAPVPIDKIESYIQKYVKENKVKVLK